MTNKPVCSHVLALSAWTLKQAHNYSQSQAFVTFLVEYYNKILLN